MLFFARTTQRIASRRAISSMASTGLIEGFSVRRGTKLNQNARFELASVTNTTSRSDVVTSRRFLSIRPAPRPKSGQELDAESIPELELHEMDTTTYLRNFATAIILASFCVGVYYYTALQAGSIRRGDRDAVDELRLEAKEAILTQRQQKLQHEQLEHSLKPDMDDEDDED